MIDVESQVPITGMDVLRKRLPELHTDLARLSRSFTESLAQTLLNMSPQEQEDLLNAMRELNAGIFAKGVSENLKRPELVTTALRGSASLLSAEPLDQFKTWAGQMTRDLTQRYALPAPKK